MFRFHQWRVYVDARDFRLALHRNILERFPKEEKYALSDQLRRATDSILLNIAEGSYRKSDKDFAHFLNQAMGSLYEVVSCFDLALDSRYIDESQYKEFINKAENLAKQLSAFTKSLKSLK